MLLKYCRLSPGDFDARITVTIGVGESRDFIEEAEAIGRVVEILRSVIPLRSLCCCYCCLPVILEIRDYTLSLLELNCRESPYDEGWETSSETEEWMRVYSAAAAAMVVVAVEAIVDALIFYSLRF